MGSSPPTPASLSALWLGLVLALAACLPVLVARYPQMSDYPAHLARYYVMIDASLDPALRSPALAHWYSFQWQWTGNVGVDLLIRPFAAIFGVEQGGRVIAGAIPPLTGLGILAVEHALRGRITPASFLAMAFIWSPMMLIGLLNFTLGLALALLGFALWVRLEGKRWRAPLFLPIALVVWLCHLSAWGVLGVLICGYEWRRGGVLAAVTAPWPLLLPLMPLVLGPILQGGGTTAEFSYGDSLWPYKGAIWAHAMRDSSYWVDMPSLVLVSVLVAAAVGFQRFDWRLGGAALLMLALSLVLPRHVSGGDYADFRMISTGLMIGCLGVDWAWPRWALWSAPLLYAGRLAITTVSWEADSAATTTLLQALDHVPVGANIASAVLVPAEQWSLDHFEHIGCYAVLRRDAMVNANFAVPHVHMLHLRQGGFADPSHRIRQGIDAPVDLAHFAPAVGANFLWYVGVKPPASLPPGAQVIWHVQAGDQFSLLARLANSAAGH